MKKAVIYARYSCERQTEQSIEGQLRVCNEYAKNNDFVVLDTYIDRAISGKSDKRDAFQAMLADSSKQEWQYVIVYKNDRFARNRIESAINKKTLWDNGVKLISATENIPDAPEGIILEALLEGMAEYYSAELSQKIKRGMNESRQKNQFTGGFVLYGYDIKDKKYIINEQEAEIVRKVFEEYADGRVVKDILTELNNRGLKNKQGRKFATNSLYRMLRTEKYAGIVRHNEETYTEIVPAIIPADLYAKVQKIIEGNKRAPARRKSYGVFLLSGKLYCGECGSLMTGDSGTSKTGAIYHYYKCFDKKRRKGCTFPSIKKDKIEDKVFDICLEVLNSGYIPNLIETAMQIREEELKQNVVILNLKAQLAEQEKQINNIMKAIENGIFTKTPKQRLTELEESIEDTKYKIACETEKQTKSLTKKDYTDFLNRFIKKQAEDEDFKATIIEMLIRKVVVFRDNRIRITFNYPKRRGGGGGDKDYEMDLKELAEAQEQHANGVQFNSHSLRQVGIIRTLKIFATAEYWGVWSSI